MANDKTEIPLKAYKLKAEKFALPLTVYAVANGFAVETPQGMAVFSDIVALKRALNEAVHEFAAQMRDAMHEAKAEAAAKDTTNG